MSRRPSPWCRTTIAFLGDLEQVLVRLTVLLVAMAAIAQQLYVSWTASYSNTRGVPDQAQSRTPFILPDDENPQESCVHAGAKRTPCLPETRRRTSSPVDSTPSDAP